MKTYYLLTKPGIIMGNLITVVAGFALASKGSFNGKLFVVTLLGLGMVIASACVCNNYIDRFIDAKMERTKGRALAQGSISGKKALVFAMILGAVGSFILGKYANLMALTIALVGFAVYVGLYSLVKVHTRHATLIGSVAGAVPPVIGYCAAGSRLDTGALVLFSLLVLWQMPHFFSIAVYRLQDYAAASIPVLPLTRGMHVTKVQMVLYILAFTGAALLLVPLGYAGYTYLGIAATCSAVWLYLCLRGFKTADDVRWAKQMFRFSLVVITALCLTLSLENFLSL